MSLNCFFNLVFLMCVYINSFSYQTLFLGRPFTPRGKMICHFYRSGGGGGVGGSQGTPP